MLVDDDTYNIDLLIEYLRPLNYRLDFALDSETAWEKLEHDPEGFDVVVLDRMMAELSGIDLLQRIKRHPRLQSLPVIMHSALASRIDIIEGMQAGAYHFMGRPFDERLLRSVLQTAVEDRQRFRRALEVSLAAGRTFGLLREAVFEFRTLEAGRDLASAMAQAFPDPTRVMMGLTELLLNAVEHGNLEIGYEDKTRLRDEQRWEAEVAARLADARYAARVVRVTLSREPEKIRVHIRDQGAGFDFGLYLDIDPTRAFDTHGRGIAMARLVSFDELHYLGDGNEVEAIVNLPPEVSEGLDEADARSA
jgi:CheY-like chemotaxis protein/anti-sigma regulatory factor (Ser/Thr protein kinase)